MSIYRLVPLASRLPHKALLWLHRKVPINQDPSDGIGWSFWMDASYHRWCRNNYDPDEIGG